MKIRKIVNELNLNVLTSAALIDREITVGYMSDILADVLAKAPKNCLWITHMTHENVIATAFFKQLVILLPEKLNLSDECLKKAAEKKMIILQSELSAFHLAGLLYAMGVSSGS